MALSDQLLFLRKEIFFVVTRKIRGKKFYKSFQEFDGPDELRIISEIDENKYYRYEANDETLAISQKDLFLYYTAIKPDFVWTIRKFKRKDYSGNDIEDILVTFNVCPISEFACRGTHGFALDIFEMYQIYRPEDMETSYLISIDCSDTEKYDMDLVMKIRLAHKEDWIDESVWFGYYGDSFDFKSITKKYLNYSSYIDPIIKKSLNDIKDAETKTDWTDVIVEETHRLKKENQAYTISLIETNIDKLVERAMNEAHIVSMTSKFIPDTIEKYKDIRTFIDTAQEACDYSMLPEDDLDDQKKKLIDEFKSVVSVLHIVAKYGIASSSRIILDDLQVIPLDKYQGKPDFDISKHYMMLLQFSDDNYAWLVYRLKPYERTKEEQQEISKMRIRKRVSEPSEDINSLLGI